MTYQRDPRRRPEDFLRRDDGSWNILPIALGVLFILLLGYFVFGPSSNYTPRGGSVTENNRTEQPKTPPATPAPEPSK